MLDNKGVMKTVALVTVAALGVIIPSVADAGRGSSTERVIRQERPARPSREDTERFERTRSENQPREIRHERERNDERERTTHREENRESSYEANRQENIREVNKENIVEDETTRESSQRKSTDTLIFSRDESEEAGNKNGADDDNDAKNENNGDDVTNGSKGDEPDNSHDTYNPEERNPANDNDVPGAANGGKILGDVNSDGKVTQEDAELLVDYIGEKIACEDLDLSVADVNKDNTINIMDAVNILNYVKGKECSPGIGERILTADLIIAEDDPRAGMTLYKPVIYLYPTKKTNVFVNLDFDGIFTCTYPRINDGWKVSAEPDGTLTAENGRKYGYLFWEGDTKVPMEFNEGFCVAGKDTEAFLVDKLSYMGLNDKEINDFIVFWLPRMQDNTYNVISFQTDNYLQAAQLQVSPQPDTMIRVFMAWKRADYFVNIQAQKLEKIQRKGFALVEWGGTEVRSGSQINLMQ